MYNLLVNLHCLHWYECFAAAAAAPVAAAAISKSYHYSEIDQKQCFCCISLIKYDLIITMKETLFYHSSIVAAASTVAATVAASKIFIKRFLLFHIELYVGLMNIDIIIWYAYIVYIDINALLLLLRLLQQQQLHSQFH